jgi:hypothetical protein
MTLMDLDWMSTPMDRHVMGEVSRIKVPWGFIIHLAVMLVAFTVGFTRLQSNQDEMKQVIDQQRVIIQNQWDVINDLRMKNARIEQDLKDFRQTYENDSNRYIREPSLKR